jgi:hypothetical protein
MEQSTSPPPPIIAVNDRVLLWYAVLDESVGYSSGHGLMYVDGKEMGEVPCLAICEDRSYPEFQFTLYYCDTNWAPIGVAGYHSVDEAKRRAERIYPGSAACWVESHFTEEDVKQYKDELFRLGDSEPI